MKPGILNQQILGHNCMAYLQGKLMCDIYIHNSKPKKKEIKKKKDMTVQRSPQCSDTM
jgi:hypothetical protein